MSRTIALFCLCILAVVCILPAAAQQPTGAPSDPPPAAVTFYACVTNSSGTLRIVAATVTCKSTEHKIQFNQTGPQGPKGVAGSRGPTGPQGQAGPQGIQGPAGLSAGVSAFQNPNTFSALGAFPGVVVLQTGGVPTTGTYYVNASILLFVDSTDLGAYCYVTPTSSGTYDGIIGGTTVTANVLQASVTDSWFLVAGDSIQVVCWSVQGDSNSSASNANVTATLINKAFNSAAKKPQVFKTPQIPGAQR